jgi:mannosyltransferase
VLRFYGLDRRSIWLDEGYSIHFARLGPAELVRQVVATDTHPPFYYLTLHLWMTLFGDSEAAVRSLSAVAGCATVAVVFAIGRIVADRSVALLAAALIALSSFNIQYSQEGRSYSFVALLTALSFYFFLKMWSSPSRLHQAGYVLTTLALLYTHLYGVFVVIAENAAFALAPAVQSGAARRPLTYRRWVAIQAVLVTAFAPWLFAVAAQGRRVISTQGELVDRPQATEVVSTLSGYTGSSLPAVIGIAIAFAVAVAGWLRSRKTTHRSDPSVTEPRGSRTVILGLWLLVPIALPLLVSLLVTPIFLFKYTIPASLAFYLLVALCWRKLGSRTAIAVGAVVLVGFALPTVEYAFDDQQENWRGAVSSLEERAEHHDLVLFDAGFTQHVFNYYSRRPDLVQRSVSDGSGRHPAAVRRRVRAAAAGRPRVWLVHSHTRNPVHLTGRVLGRSLVRRSHRSFEGVDVYLYEAPTQD